MTTATPARARRTRRPTIAKPPRLDTPTEEAFIAALRERLPILFGIRYGADDRREVTALAYAPHPVDIVAPVLPTVAVFSTPQAILDALETRGWLRPADEMIVKRTVSVDPGTWLQLTPAGRAALDYPAHAAPTPRADQLADLSGVRQRAAAIVEGLMDTRSARLSALIEAQQAVRDDLGAIDHLDAVVPDATGTPARRGSGLWLRGTEQSFQAVVDAFFRARADFFVALDGLANARALYAALAPWEGEGEPG